MRRECALSHLQLAEQHGTRGPEARHDGCVPFGDKVLVHGHPCRTGDALRMAHILHADRHAMQQTTVQAPGDLMIGVCRCLKGNLTRNGGVAS